MSSIMTAITTKLLFFICIIQGTQNVFKEHEKILKAAVGQNLTLRCITSEEHEININQLEWSRANQKLVVFNPAYPIHYDANVTLRLINRTDTAKLQGSVLILNNVKKNDTGDYVCDITTFPNGSIKRIISVQVMDPKVFMEVMPSTGILIEGDMVNITCGSNPPADSYTLWHSQSNLSLKSQNGDFTIQNITRHSDDLMCQPLWNSSNPHLQGLRSSKQLTVDFLDSIECNSSSQIQVETGTNLIITCEAMSSKSLQYVWKKGNLIVSSDVTLRLWSVNISCSGIYTLTVNAENHSRLYRQRNFTVTVLNRTHTAHMETSQTSRTTLTTAGTTIMTSQSGHVSSPSYSTSTMKGASIKTTSPPAGNITTLQAHVTTLGSDLTNTATTSADVSREGCCKWQNATSSPVSPRSAHFNTSTVTSASVSKIIFTSEGTKKLKQTHEVYILIPLFLLLVLIGFLYRRYIIQKRMDKPPPFKPPPPPVKYTSVRDHNLRMTDILV
ncbi:serine/threonine-rich protein adg2 isoform X2 [Electrophorus electricus]|uniref:serine/threonine-rich protein adg2 isoform X2 n=1 Tax=Electrophorus electricus TaxID=8005 RepID=UPI0015CFA4A4|nr:serine/threonine-rich protein adg2 isoform X2 [Electrophorus electricus]